MADGEKKPIPDDDDELKYLMEAFLSEPRMTYKDWLKKAYGEIRRRSAGARWLSPARRAAIRLRLEIQFGIKCDCCGRLLPAPDPWPAPHPWANLDLYGPRRCRACQDVEGPIR